MLLWMLDTLIIQNDEDKADLYLVYTLHAVVSVKSVLKWLKRKEGQKLQKL
jgi:hypothetical protein